MRYLLLLLPFIIIFSSCSTENTPVYVLKTSANGEGTISPTGGEFEEGELVKISGIPKEGWLFKNWSGDERGADSQITVSMYSDKFIEGNFKRILYLNENGITIMCPEGEVDQTWKLNGKDYEIVDNELLNQRRNHHSNLSKVCVSLIRNMNSLFRELPFNQNIGNWDVSNVRDMRTMFYKSDFNQDISSWNVANVQDFSNMFFRSPFNQSISEWDVGNVTDMSSMFSDSPFNRYIGDWNVGKVEVMGGMFSNSSFNQPISDWDVSNVTSMGGMFRNSEFNHPIGGWDVSKVTYMRGMFRNSEFNHPIGDWNVSKVTDMNGMFSGSNFNQDISGWCVSQFKSEPDDFSTDSPLTEENKPVWGTCPN